MVRFKFSDFTGSIVVSDLNGFGGIVLDGGRFGLFCCYKGLLGVVTFI